MSCVCYPPDFGLQRGCQGESQCWVSRENKLLGSEEGRHQLRAEYDSQLKKRFEDDEKEPDFSELAFRLQKIGVPGVALSIAKNPASTPAYEGARKWWFGDKQLVPALVLSGGVGVGKTVAAAFICVEWAKRWNWNGGATGTLAEPLVWLDGPRLVRLGNLETADALGDMAFSAKLLVVDDAGREASKVALTRLSDVLMNRLDNRRMTILSTNLTGENFRVRYGEALADRLRSCASVPLLGSSKSMRVARQ